MITRTIVRFGITYEVRLHPQERGRWVVLREREPTGGFGTSIHMAVNGAVAEAKLEAKSSDVRIKVISVDGETRTLEWDSADTNQNSSSCVR